MVRNNKKKEKKNSKKTTSPSHSLSHCSRGWIWRLHASSTQASIYKYSTWVYMQVCGWYNAGCRRQSTRVWWRRLRWVGKNGSILSHLSGFVDKFTNSIAGPLRLPIQHWQIDMFILKNFERSWSVCWSTSGFLSFFIFGLLISGWLGWRTYFDSSFFRLVFSNDVDALNYRKTWSCDCCNTRTDGSINQRSGEPFRRYFIKLRQSNRTVEWVHRFWPCHPHGSLIEKRCIRSPSLSCLSRSAFLTKGKGTAVGPALT